MIPNCTKNLLGYWLSGLILLASTTVLAQTPITGTVTGSEDGLPLISATVQDPDNPSIGTVTDFDGNYSIVPGQNTTHLQFSYVGYESQRIEIGDQTEINVVLSPGSLLGEVVIIGYGTVEREDVTGSVQTVEARDFNQGAITSPQELLSGKVPGVTVTTGGGGPDEGAQIRIRGLSSLDASNDPLIVVDGIPLASGGVSGNRNPLNIINPRDIESITVLKDASATAIYGSRGSAGVILITTKRGSFGTPTQISYDANFSIGTAITKVDVLSPTEFRQVMEDQEPNQLDLMGDANNEWQDEIYRNAVGTDHNIGVSGSITETFPYRVSLGYTHKEGILLTDQFERYTAGINLTPHFFDSRLQLNVGIRGMLNKNKFAERGAIGAAVSFDPTREKFDEESEFSGYSVWTLPNGNPNLLAPTNPISLLDRDLRQDNSEVTRYIINASADYRFGFLPTLRATLNLGYDYSQGEGGVDIVGNNMVAYSFNQNTGGGLVSTYDERRKNELIEFYMNYGEKFGDHSLDAMAGYSWQRFYDKNSFFRSDVAMTPAETQQQDDIAREMYLLSLFGRVNYTFRDRYLLTFTLRGDATSRFASENRWGVFPALAGAYKVFENDDRFFNDLKLRAGWGITGQQEIGGYYIYQAVYEESLDNARYRFGDDFVTTIRPNGYDRNIKWEETTTYNVGLDFSIIADRLQGTFDLYRRDTRDLLGLVDVPAGTNLTNRIFTNVGNMRSEGVELAIFTSPVVRRDFRWDVSTNVNYNTNEITRLTATNDPDFPGVEIGGISGGVGSNIQIHSVGHEPFSFYVFEQQYDEEGNLIEGEFKDRNGDGTVSDDDKYRFRSPAPRVTWGITSNFTWKGFEFSLAGRAHFGNYVYNNVATDLGHFDQLYHPTNYLSNIHRSAFDNNIQRQSNVLFSDHFVADASFFRMDHITIGYNFNTLNLGGRNLTETIGLNHLRIYATVQNPFIITSYDGLDPEIPNGIDNNFYPRPRTFLMGLSVTF
ncbi:MAG: SusC/RagA family TonB-linked outer membrane protein [Saprospirales bacterium]|nr:MAG: SusC/RagA family TonB-linked outer membrane protein [Saprospirales bacterium]